MVSGGLRTKGITKSGTKEHPLITVVTVVFNGEKTLEQTILSVVNQTYDNVEYIVIDGASTDKTLDIIKKYEDKIDYWVSEPDKGIYDAMNKGIDFSTGDWINFMNSGDYFHDESVLEKLADPELLKYDVIYGDSVELDGNSRIYRKARDNTNLLSLFPIYRHGASFVKGVVHKKNKFDLSRKELGFGLDYNCIYSLKTQGFPFHKVNHIILDFDKNGVSDNLFDCAIFNYRITCNKRPVAALLVLLLSIVGIGKTKIANFLFKKYE